VKRKQKSNTLVSENLDKVGQIWDFKISMNDTIHICKEQVSDKIWRTLCEHGLDAHIYETFRSKHDLHVVQIGAHTGFEKNDPLGRSLSKIIQQNHLQTRVHWTFVEPSPPNYKKLEKTLHNHSHICNMRSVNAAVVSDKTPDAETENKVFYTLLDTIDPETGFDSRSGKSLPSYITQVSSFSKNPILFNRNQFSRKGLNVNDYIVPVNVTVRHLSSLLTEITANSGGFKPGHLFFVLIDTEGYDCDIINGLSKDSPFWPFYLMFEHKSCKKGDKKRTIEHLIEMGYTVSAFDGENTLALR